MGDHELKCNMDVDGTHKAYGVRRLSPGTSAFWLTLPATLALSECLPHRTHLISNPLHSAEQRVAVLIQLNPYT